MFTNEEIEKMDYEQMAKRIVYQCDTPEELRAAIAKTLELVAVWEDKEARNEVGDGQHGPINQSDDHYRSEVAATLLNEYNDVHQSSERLEAEIAKHLGYEYGRGCKTADNGLQNENYELKQRIAKLEADLNTMSGIMREYSQGFFNVCEQIKAMEATNGQG